jgi:hypothetical protein
MAANPALRKEITLAMPLAPVKYHPIRLMLPVKLDFELRETNPLRLLRILIRLHDDLGVSRRIHEFRLPGTDMLGAA